MRSNLKTKKAGPLQPRELVGIPPGVDALLSPKQVAAALSCSTRELYRLISNSEWPEADTPPGKHPRWRVSTFNRAVERLCELLP